MRVQATTSNHYVNYVYTFIFELYEQHVQLLSVR